MLTNNHRNIEGTYNVLGNRKIRAGTIAYLGESWRANKMPLCEIINVLSIGFLVCDNM